MNWLDKKPIIVLAPMAGMTDSPFCRVCRLVNSEPEGEESLLGASKFVIFREMVSAEAIVRGNEKTLKMCEFDPVEKPIVLQIFGAEPNVIVEAAKRILEKGSLTAVRDCVCDGIDINMGCPVPKIAGKADSGAVLMKDHKRAVEIVKALKQANLGLPISVKTRLGWAKDDEILEFAPKLEQAGADALTIHGRTKKQGYTGQANWEMIGRVKKLVKIPVIANGDIATLEDGKIFLETTGCDGVMIGRAALGNPWIFGVKSYKVHKVESSELVRVVLRHAELHLEHYGEGSMVTFRKHLLHYFKNMPNVKDLRMKLARVGSLEELKSILQKIPGLS